MSQLLPQIVWKAQPGPQTFLLTCPINDIFFGGARGGGKTDGLLGDFASFAERYGSHVHGILFRRSTTELSEVERRSYEIYGPIGARYAIVKKTWTMPNGARLKLRFIEHEDDPTKYQGHSYNWMAFDELTNWPSPDLLDQLRATLRNPYGIPARVISTGNPGGKGHEWVKKRYIKPAPPLTPFFDDEKKVWRVYIPSKLSDNKILVNSDTEYQQRLVSSGPSWLVKAWLEGDWDSVQVGSIFRREDWQYYKELPHLEFIIQSWDTAFKTNNSSDYSVCVTIGATKTDLYVIDVWRGKVEFPELKRVAVNLHDKYKPNEVCVEDKASGQSLVQELNRGTRIAVKAVQVEGDKVARAYASSPMLEAKKVWLPERAPWLNDFCDELAQFPHGANDDQVDAYSQGVTRIIHKNQYRQGLYVGNALTMR